MNWKRWIPATVCLVLSTLIFPLSSFGEEMQLSIPVSYRLLPEGKTIEGFIVGGSIFEPDGLVVFEASATASSIIEYPAIDRLESLRMDPNGHLTMKLTLSDNSTILAYAQPPKGVPLMLLADATASGTGASPAPVRTFTPENFRGIDLIEVEAGISLDFSELEPLAGQFLNAIKAKDVEQTNAIFEKFLPMFLEPDQDQGTENQDGPTESGVQGTPDEEEEGEGDEDPGSDPQ